MPAVNGGVCITLERFRQIREESECSMMEAKRTATIEAISTLIDRATSVDDLKPILRTLASTYSPTS
jgi:hypothetical protein